MNWHETFADQSSRALMWMALGLALGIGIYFAWPSEPGIWVLLGMALLGGIGLLISKGSFLILSLAVSATFIGFGYAGLRAHLVEAPRLDWPYSGILEGTIVAIDSSYSGAPRLTLVDPLILQDNDPPQKIRITLSKEQSETFLIGQRISVKAIISPPLPKTDPDGYDFQRAAWFMRLGAVGYTRDPPVILDTQPNQSQLVLGKIRQNIGFYLDRKLDARTAPIVRALVIGDRSQIPADDMQALRDSNLAHLLAISGLHMGLLTALIFSLVRLSLAMIYPGWSGRRVKKAAAISALVAGFVYLLLSGLGIATQRAFVMVGVMLLAILFDRPAISLRSLVVAALILLLWKPENLLHAGFQMSFAATSALVFGFDAARPWFAARTSSTMREGSALVLSSFLAGAATAPIAAYHFNRLALFGLPANLATVPLMGLIIMPSLMLGTALDVIGLDRPFFWAVELAVGWILNVSHSISSQPNSVAMVQTAPGYVLAIVSIGWCFFLMWKGRLRYAGLVAMCLGFVFWGQGNRPDILVSPRSGAVGIMTKDGRVVNKDRSSAFEITQWLENDGDARSQEHAAQDWPQDNLAAFSRNVFVYSSSRKPSFWLPCEQGQVIIAPKLDMNLQGDCIQITARNTSKTKAIAITLNENGAELAPVSGSGRIWQD